MCARLKFSGRLVGPGQTVLVRSDAVKKGRGKWVGFARTETIEEKWNGWTPIDIPASEFAEYNRPASRESGTNVLTWAPLDGNVIYGIGNRETGEVRIITREATEEEFEKFGHNRIPLILERRF